MVWRCINTFTIIIYNTCTYDVRKKFSNFSDVPLFDSRTKEKNACPGNALLGIENSYE